VIEEKIQHINHNSLQSFIETITWAAKKKYFFKYKSLIFLLKYQSLDFSCLETLSVLRFVYCYYKQPVTKQCYYVITFMTSVCWSVSATTWNQRWNLHTPWELWSAVRGSGHLPMQRQLRSRRQPSSYLRKWIVGL